MKYHIGIDIGSTCAKTVVPDDGGEILHRLLRPTGWSSVETAPAPTDGMPARWVRRCSPLP